MSQRIGWEHGGYLVVALLAALAVVFGLTTVHHHDDDSTRFCRLCNTHQEPDLPAVDGAPIDVWLTATPAAPDGDATRSSFDVLTSLTQRGPPA